MGQGDWKRFACYLERTFEKQFAPEPTSVKLEQTNNTLNLTDGHTLQQARRALDEVKAIKDARRKQNNVQ
jgi:hypothetical protein